MKKKFIITGLSVLFILVSGICYSCAFSSKTDTVLLSAQSTQSQDKQADKNGSGADLTTPKPEPETVSVVATDVSAQSISEKMIYVHICGEVKTPGVYEALEGARLIDIITLSGGLTEEAAADFINQAQQVSDGQRYYIPAKAEVEGLSSVEFVEGSQGSSEEKETSLVNINKAGEEELMSLPGIGEAKARSIIAYRTSNGNFSTTEDLMKIPGIKEGLFNQIALLITAE